MTTNHARRLAGLLLLPPALFALACALFAPAEAGRAPAARRATQNREKGEAVPAASTVRGRVVYDDTSRPVRRARLSLVGEGGTRTEYGALTDARGDFQIKGVRAGSYLVSVNVPGVLSPNGFTNLGGPRGVVPDVSEGRKFFDVVEVDGKQDVTVTVHARRGGTIAGRVTYADGDPATGVTVTLMRRDAQGQLQKYMLGPSSGAFMGNKTDDRGQFRLPGLPPGEYFVAVSEAVAHGEDAGRDYDVPGVLEEMIGQQLLQTFHPSASSVKEAAAVKVEAGEERSDVDIVIPDRELRTVAGTVRTRRDGRPVARARVAIARRDASADSAPDFYVTTSGLSHNATTTDEDGRWQFKEIPDGAYSILVKPPEEYEVAGVMMNTNANVTITNANVTIVTGNMNGDSRPQRRRKAFAPARRDVDVSGGDVSEVAVEVSEGARVSGTVTVEGGAAPRFAYVNLLRVPEGGDRPAPSDFHNATVESGRFNADGLDAGRFFLHASIYDEESKFYVKSITWKGRDLLREPLELGEGASVDGVEVVFSRNPATLRVSAVAASGGKRAPGAGVFLLPAGEWQPYSGLQLFCWTEEDGVCSVTAPPGEYRVVTLPQKLMRATPEAEVRRRAGVAPRVSLRAGETKELEVVASDR